MSRLSHFSAIEPVIRNGRWIDGGKDGQDGEDAAGFLSSGPMALVVYDMQVGILHQVKDGAAVTGKVKAVLDAARRSKFPVIFLRHLSMPKPLMGGFQMRQAMAWQRVDNADDVHPWFLRDSPGFAIAPELAPGADEAILDKIPSPRSRGRRLRSSCAISV